MDWLILISIFDAILEWLITFRRVQTSVESLRFASASLYCKMIAVSKSSQGLDILCHRIFRFLPEGQHQMLIEIGCERMDCSCPTKHKGVLTALNGDGKDAAVVFIGVWCCRRSKQMPEL